MNRATSAYLDAIRFAAAMVVFLGHVGERGISGGFLWQFTQYGAAAVVVFFVLSGFVVGYVAHEKEHGWSDYAAARCVRLYSVVIPALTLTLILDFVGARLSPGAYVNYDAPLATAAARYAFSLAFLNETRFGSFFPGSNGPYWSLGYEAAYYALFGFAFYTRGWLRILGCGALVLLVRTHVLMLLPLWLVGLLTYRICRGDPIGPSSGMVLFLASSVAGIAYIVWASIYGFLAQYHALFEHDLGQMAQDLVLAVIFAANILGLHAISRTIPDRLMRLAATIRWLAGASFTLYILHMPALTFVKAASIWSENSWIYRGALLFVPLGIVFVTAELGERRKDFWRGLIRLGARPDTDAVPAFAKRP